MNINDIFNIATTALLKQDLYGVAEQEKIVNLLMAWIEKQMKNTPIK